jgi:hypothetical protein
MYQNSAGLIYLKNKFSRISDAEIKEGVFVGCQIRELIQDVKFEGQLNDVEKQHGNHSKMSLPVFWEIIMQCTVVIWWLILCNPTKLWSVMCL